MLIYTQLQWCGFPSPARLEHHCNCSSNGDESIGGTMITQEQLKELIHYDPDTGVVTWLRRPADMFTTQRSFNTWNSRFSGKQAGNITLTSDGKKYIQIGLFGKTKQIHRVIWIYMTGKNPTRLTILHGDGTDNRWCNLREVDNAENGKNQRLSVNNTSGISGVSWFKPIGKWQAHIMVAGKRVSLKYHNHEAACARKSAENRYNFHKNHGSVRPL